jgi:hypothetical protein
VIVSCNACSFRGARSLHQIFLQRQQAWQQLDEHGIEPRVDGDPLVVDDLGNLVDQRVDGGTICTYVVGVTEPGVVIVATTDQQQTQRSGPERDDPVHAQTPDTAPPRSTIRSRPSRQRMTQRG